MNVANENEIPACCITFLEFCRKTKGCFIFAREIYYLHYCYGYSGMLSEKSVQKYIHACTIVGIRAII